MIDVPTIPRRRLGHVARKVALLVLFVGLVALAVAPGRLTPYSPEHRASASLMPAGWSDGDGTYVLGTDVNGRDFLSALVRSIQFSLLMAGFGTILVVAGSLGWGITIGLSKSRAITAVAGAVTLGVMGLPDLVVLATLRGLWPWESQGWSSAGLATASNLTVVTAAAFLATPAMAQLLADRVRALNVSPATLATRGIGAGTAFIVRREFLPHLRPILGWIVARKFPFFVALEATLDLLSLPYRNAAGLGACLAACWRHAHSTVGQFQLLATVLVLVLLCLSPQFLLALMSRSSGRQGNHD